MKRKTYLKRIPVSCPFGMVTSTENNARSRPINYYGWKYHKWTFYGTILRNIRQSYQSQNRPKRGSDKSYGYKEVSSKSSDHMKDLMRHILRPKKLQEILATESRMWTARCVFLCPHNIQKELH
ncbi:Hypothetical predicted protein [Octopus vulgaris]|uniref:Uncharacterized protein n=1 Tax=Octopus vulgaris TaxID=6645 RepID=A0AA36F390_OCTVU|nr:Hypothetical predicted protein [Octopus vulgaris]